MSVRETQVVECSVVHVVPQCQVKSECPNFGLSENVQFDPISTQWILPYIHVRHTMYIDVLTFK